MPPTSHDAHPPRSPGALVDRRVPHLDRPTGRRSRSGVARVSYRSGTHTTQRVLVTARPHHATQQTNTPISPLYPPDTDPPLHLAQQLARILVDRWHQSGRRGKGVKVAILDSGFRGYRDHLGKSLPAKVTTGSFRLDQNL